MQTSSTNIVNGDTCFFIQPEIPISAIGVIWKLNFTFYLATTHHLVCLIMLLHIFSIVPRFWVHTMVLLSGEWE